MITKQNITTSLFSLLYSFHIDSKSILLSIIFCSQILDKIKTNPSLCEQLQIDHFISVCTEEQLDYLSSCHLLITTSTSIDNAILLRKNAEFLETLIDNYLNQSGPPISMNESVASASSYADYQYADADEYSYRTDENTSVDDNSFIKEPHLRSKRSLFWSDSDEEEEKEEELPEPESLVSKILSQYQHVNLSLLLRLIEKENIVLTKNIIAQIDNSYPTDDTKLVLLEKWRPSKEEDIFYKETILQKNKLGIAGPQERILFSNPISTSSEITQRKGLSQ